MDRETVREDNVNKSELVDALAGRLEGDKKAANAAVDAFVDLVQRTVNKGEKVSIAGFGVFEKRIRAARTARNPATGASIKLKKTSVPAFRPGTQFKGIVSGSVKLAALAKPAAKKAAAPAKAAAAKATPAKKSTATKTTAAKKTAAAKVLARKAPAKKANPAKTTAAKKTAAAKVLAKKAPAKATRK